MARIDADGSRPSNDSSRAEAIFTRAGGRAGRSFVCYVLCTTRASQGVPGTPGGRSHAYFTAQASGLRYSLVSLRR